MKSIRKSLTHKSKKTTAAVHRAGVGKKSHKGEKIVAGMQDAVAFAKIDRLWRQTKKRRGEDISEYDWGYRDGLMAARALFGRSSRADRPAAPEVSSGLYALSASDFAALQKKLDNPTPPNAALMRLLRRKTPAKSAAIKKGRRSK